MMAETRAGRSRWWVRGRVLLGLAALASGILAWRHPMATLALVSRAALRLCGFKKAEALGRSGRIAYFRRMPAGGRAVAAEGVATVVLVHGANDQAGTWARVAPSLDRRFRVVIVDLAGHGDSDPTEGPLTPQHLVDGLAAVVGAEAGSGPLILVGNSLGGWLSLIYALDHQDEVGQVVLINGAINRTDRQDAAGMLLPRTREDARRAMDVLTSPTSPRIPSFVLDDLVRRAPGSPFARLMAQSPEVLDSLLIDARLGELRVPVTMIWGEADRLLSIDYARRAVAALPRARLEILPDCGHLPQRECPAALLPLLADVLARASSAGTASGGD